ncbi:MAG: DUF4065 domain-containing protein [Bacillota bacterium]|nr:DUF4065 domain-containing protein [Bacillota bacterium]
MDVLLISNTILQRAFQDNIPVTPMKLQKLIYLVYREYLKRTGNPLFSERFEAWKYGPVLSCVYNCFKHYCASPILNYYIGEEGKAKVYDLRGNSAFSQVINQIWDRYKDEGAIQLSSKTHQAGSAWDKANLKGELFLNDEDIKSESWV